MALHPRDTCSPSCAAVCGRRYLCDSSSFGRACGHLYLKCLLDLLACEASCTGALARAQVRLRGGAAVCAVHTQDVHAQCSVSVRVRALLSDMRHVRRCLLRCVSAGPDFPAALQICTPRLYEAAEGVYVVAIATPNSAAAPNTRSAGRPCFARYPCTSTHVDASSGSRCGTAAHWQQGCTRSKAVQ